MDKNASFIGSVEENHAQTNYCKTRQILNKYANSYETGVGKVMINPTLMVLILNSINPCNPHH